MPKEVRKAKSWAEAHRLVIKDYLHGYAEQTGTAGGVPGVVHMIHAQLAYRKYIIYIIIFRLPT